MTGSRSGGGAAAAIAGILGGTARLTGVTAPDQASSSSPGDHADVDITDVTSTGDGVGRTAAGLVLMIPGAVPGDRVRARLERLRRGYAEARLETLITPSPDRAEPRCAHFGQCGGCTLQNLSAEAQRRVKHARLTRQFAGLGGPARATVEPVRAAGPPYGFRGRMEFSFGGPPAAPRLGLHERAGGVFPLQECHLPDPVFARIVTRLDAVARVGGGGAGMRRLEIRRAAHSGRLLVTLRAEGAVPEAMLAALRALETAEPAVAGVFVARGAGHRSAPHRLWGQDTIEDVVLGLRLPIGPDGFVQTHPAGAEALYAEVLAALRPGSGRRLLDLYSGLGVVGMAAARHGAEVLCIEVSTAATQVCATAAAHNGTPVRLVRGDVTRTLRQLAGAGERFDGACLNPPRAGIPPSLPGLLAATGVRTLAYISCHPATLARDAARLAEVGIGLTRVVPFDFFPHTAQVECLALFVAVVGGGLIDAGRQEG